MQVMIERDARTPLDGPVPDNSYIDGARSDGTTGRGKSGDPFGPRAGPTGSWW